jgi:hypothetical protein
MDRLQDEKGPDELIALATVAIFVLCRGRRITNATDSLDASIWVSFVSVTSAENVAAPLLRLPLRQEGTALVHPRLNPAKHRPGLLTNHVDNNHRARLRTTLLMGSVKCSLYARSLFNQTRTQRGWGTVELLKGQWIVRRLFALCNYRLYIGNPA